MEYERQTREQRYVDSGAQYQSLQAFRFKPPAVSQAAAERLKKALNNAPPFSINESGDGVTALQAALIDLRHPSIKIPDGATGYFGKQTQEALTAFQNAAKLSKRDGMAGTETMARLDDFYARGSKLDEEPSPPEDEITVWCPNLGMIPRLKQTPGNCWATAAAMMYYWKNPYELNVVPDESDRRVQYVLSQTGGMKWQLGEIYRSGQGLPTNLNRDFYAGSLGMQWDGSSPYADYTLAFWTSKLVKGPVLVSGGRQSESLQLHAFLVVGVERDLSIAGRHTFFVLDPMDGAIKELTIARLLLWVGWLPDGVGPFEYEISHTMQFRDRIFYW